MIDDPHSYDLTEFAREFTWSILFWNSAEVHARSLLHSLLGGKAPIVGLVADLGSRSLIEALRSAARGVEDHQIREHLLHYTTGFSRLNEYRNLYVHGLTAVTIDPSSHGMVRKLQGQIMTLRGKGRLRAVNQPLTTVDVLTFKDWCLKLSSYGEAIKMALGLSDDTFRKMLEMPEPSLERPEWPAPPNLQIHYIQD